MTAKRKWKKILAWIGGFVSLAMVLLIAFPFWFPWVAAPLARKAGVRYGKYVRENYSHFRLESVNYTNRQTSATADRVILLVPTAWAWRLIRSDESTVYAEVNRWTVTTATSANGPPAGTSTYLQSLAGQLGKLDRWLPVAVLTEGSMHINGQTVSIDRLVWRRGKFELRIEPAAQGIPRGLNFAWQAAGPS